jgi:hypothetical protein
LLLRILGAINRYHQQAFSPLYPLSEQLFFTAEGPSLLWLRSFPQTFHPREDLQQLGAWVKEHVGSRFSSTTLPGLIAEWSEHPPPSAATALTIARSYLYQGLYGQLQLLEQRHKKMIKQYHVSRLLLLSSRLNGITPPQLELRAAGEELVWQAGKLTWSAGQHSVSAGSGPAELRVLRTLLLSEENLSEEGVLLRRWVEQKLALLRKLSFLKIKNNGAHR